MRNWNHSAIVRLLAAAALTAAPLVAPPAGHAQAPADRAGRLAFWESLGDTTLVRLVGLALSANADIHVATARVEQARSVRLSAALDLAPTITATAGYTRQRLPMAAVPGAIDRLPANDYWDTGVEAAWELDLFGRLRRGLRGRNAQVDASEADAQDVEVLVAAELARGYVEMRGLQGQLAVARLNAENQQRTLDLTRQRLDAGRGTAFDTERATAQLNLTLAAIPTLEARIASAQYRIGVLTGRNPASMAEELAIPAALPALPDLPAVVAPDAIVRNRPDVVGAERRLAAETAFHRAAKADYLPRIALVGGYGTSASDFDRIGGRGTSRFAVGPVISWPLLNLGRVRANADEVAARKDAAKAAYDQAILRGLEEVEAVSVRYRAARARLDRLEQAAQASQRAADLARLRFEGGIADFLQVLDADRTQLATQDLLAQGRMEAATAYVDVYRALRGRWPAAAE
jgi:NodT family efflux transporter outer membrane factor (OMF) lipoprotein